ncbi:M20/M25/M40 family metallo-hydrolase [Novosphingobium sp. TH158]|uniref:M20/M25/M40 family metallo-hydrolase n=1 Tax=Novosphingobium sp. TH158 TaxID=2067455 RepID=UPI000C7B3489|nr:M20/M25/M40 family metallo-hydrolase [Novosphingobium sp. TH158]PLK25980.1 peptidase M20 [Novosphingobium sp. TH158]
MKGWAGFIAALVAAIGLAILGTTPPGPVPDTAGAGAFSAGRAMIDVRQIAEKPHPTGTPENAEVRAYLVNRLKSLGLEVREVDLPLPQLSTERMQGWSKGSHAPTRMVNVIGVLPGKDRTLPAVALMAHHDTVWGSPGAADDTAGIATILEAVRAIKARGQPLRDLAVVITDAEELGLSGAEAFFASDPLRARIGMIVNMEARGGGGRTTLFETSPDNGNAVALYADAVSRPGASSLAAFIYSVLPNDTDLSVSLRADYPGYNFAFIGRSGLYHSPLATPERLDQGALQDMGGQVLALTDRLVRSPSLPQASPSVVFFDVFGLFLVTYPAWIGWIMVAAIGLGLASAVRRDCRLHAVLGGSGRMLGMMLGTGVALYALNLVSGAGSQANYYDRLAAIPKLEIMALLACAGMFLLAFGRGAGKAARVGATLVLAVLGAIAQLLAPTAAYVVLIPVLLAVLALCLPGGPGKAIGWLGAALVLGYEIYLGHFAMQGVGPTMPFVVSVPLALATLAILALWPGLAPRAARRGALAALALSLLVSLWVRFDPIADTVAVYSSDKNVPAIPITKPKK